MLAGCACCVTSAFGQAVPITSTNTFSVGKAIPDGNLNGLVDVEHLSFTNPQLFSITDLKVTLDITGGFNGDYYAYLVHNGGYSVLLNRVGVTASNPVGYADSGMNITLSVASPNDIHNYQSVVNPGGGLLTGTFNADGRTTDPLAVLNTDPQIAGLSSFDGQDPSGDWTLFLADVDYGEQGTLTSWGLVVTAVPEPGTYGILAMGLGSLAGMRWFRRRS